LLAALDGRAGVYDHVPEDAPYPFVDISAHTVTPRDTLSTLGHDHQIILTVWSSYRGKTEVRAICDSIEAAFHRADLTLAHGLAVRCQVASVVIRPDGGDTHQGSVTLGILTQEEI
jgi:hypothetical protein